MKVFIIIEFFRLQCIARTILYVFEYNTNYNIFYERNTSLIFKLVYSFTVVSCFLLSSLCLFWKMIKFFIGSDSGYYELENINIYLT